MCRAVHVTLCSCCLVCKQHHSVALREKETFCCMKINKTSQFDADAFAWPLNTSSAPLSLRKIPHFAQPWCFSHPVLPVLGCGAGCQQSSAAEISSHSASAENSFQENSGEGTARARMIWKYCLNFQVS